MDTRCFVRFLALVVAAAAPVRGQDSRPATIQPGATPAAVVMGEEPIRIQSVGLTVHVPEGTRASSERTSDRSVTRISPTDDPDSWILTIDTPASRDHNLSTVQVADKVLQQVLDSVGIPKQKFDPKQGITTESIETAGKVLERTDTISIPGSKSPGSRFYTLLPRGPGEPPAVRGYTVFPAGAGRFVSFDLITTEPNFARARTIYETIIAAATFDDADALAAARGGAVESGITLMSSLTPADLRRVVESRAETWYRLYREAPGKAALDATELGYQHVKAWVGQRGDLDPTKQRSHWKSSDRQQGFLVLIEGRSLLEGQTIDSRAVYFMTPDRGEETWTIQMAVRTPGRRDPATWLESGARSGGSMSVSVSGTAEVGKQAKPTVPDQGYVTQVEGMLLPQIMLRGAKPGDFGFYVYQSEFGNVRLRRDVLEQVPDDPSSWRLTTRMTEEKEPRVSLYKSTGELISSRQADGAVMEPTTLDRLVELWRRKNLPMN
ncbi:MAG: hypothetical protein IT437_08990 [Phycisphaerales bacterium]|nr:hypothetical protein [Phycisphaerales bacterium]